MLIRSLFLLLTAVALSALPRPDTREQLRRLARLPHLQPPQVLLYSHLVGFVPFPDATEIKAEIEQLRKDLKGNQNHATVLLQIGLLQERLGKRDEALILWVRARELLRKQIGLEPHNALARARLGWVLALTDAFTEAEFHLREAARLQPDHAEILVAFGQVHLLNAWKTLVPDEQVLGKLTFEAILQDLLHNPPDPQRIAAVSHQLQLAAPYFSKIEDLAPDDPQLILTSAAYCHFQSAIRSLLRALSNRSSDFKQIRKDLFPPCALEKLEQAVSNSAAPPSVLAIAALLPIYHFSHQQQMESEELHQIWGALEEMQRRPIQSALSKLQALAETPSKDQLQALELLGCLQFIVLQDHSGAEKSLRQALVLGSTSDRAWDVLGSVLQQSGRKREIVELSERRASKFPSAKNRLLLAKAYDQAGQFELAQATMFQTVQSYGNDFLANLALANLLMKRADAPELSSRIRDAINKAERNLGPNPSFENMLDLALSKSLYFALVEDYSRARKILQEWLAVSPQNKEIRAALEAIGY